MIKQLVLPLVAVAAFIVIVGLLVKNSANIALPGVPQKTVTIGSKTINVEVAKTPDERTRGLSGRYSLGEENGMLFVFDAQNITPNFWMKGMLIPLDIIWINDGKIVKIDKNAEAPKENTPDQKLTIYAPGIPIDYVLEVNAGFSDKNNVKVGNSVDLAKIQ